MTFEKNGVSLSTPIMRSISQQGAAIALQGAPLFLTILELFFSEKKGEQMHIVCRAPIRSIFLKSSEGVTTFFTSHGTQMITYSTPSPFKYHHLKVS